MKIKWTRETEDRYTRNRGIVQHVSERMWEGFVDGKSVGQRPGLENTQRLVESVIKVRRQTKIETARRADSSAAVARCARIRGEVELFTRDKITVPELLHGFAIALGRSLRSDEIDDFERVLRSAHEAA